MRQPELTITYVKKGNALPEGFLRLIEEAGQAMAGLTDLQGMPYTPESVGLDGARDLIFLLCGEEPAGVMSCEIKGDDAQLLYCHVREAYKAYEGLFFTLAVRHFKSAGMHVARTYFNWPSPDPCIVAATAMGFMPMERIEMARESDRDYSVRPLPQGTEIVPWSDVFLDDAAWLLSENGNEIDRQIYPQEQTFAGARAQLKKITGNMYGDFLADQSMIARAGGEMIGMLLATERDGPSILIPQVILDRDHRGQGVASALIGRLIRDIARRGDRKITLIVNGQNADAIRLYGRKGFRPVFVYEQYVLPIRQ